MEIAADLNDDGAVDAIDLTSLFVGHFAASEHDSCNFIPWIAQVLKNAGPKVCGIKKENECRGLPAPHSAGEGL